MKKNIGKSLALYPTPLVVVGTMVHGRPNYVLVGHVGIIGHDRIMVSLAKPHYTNQGIKETKALTVNIVDEAMLKKADRTGCVSGNKVDKSEMFQFHTEGTGEGFESFICKIDGVYAEESVLNEAGKIDYHTLKPVLFEMPTYEYLRTGDVIGKCMNLDK